MEEIPKPGIETKTKMKADVLAEKNKVANEIKAEGI